MISSRQNQAWLREEEDVREVEAAMAVLETLPEVPEVEVAVETQEVVEEVEGGVETDRPRTAETLLLADGIMINTRAVPETESLVDVLEVVVVAVVVLN